MEQHGQSLLSKGGLRYRESAMPRRADRTPGRGQAGETLTGVSRHRGVRAENIVVAAGRVVVENVRHREGVEARRGECVDIEPSSLARTARPVVTRSRAF